MELGIFETYIDDNIEDSTSIMFATFVRGNIIGWKNIYQQIKTKFRSV